MRRAVFATTCLLLPLLSSWRPVSAQGNPQGRSIPINGFEMYYETLGEGEPLLLVHGWSGSADYFGPLLQALSSRYRLIIPELRGHGRSTNPEGSFTTRQSARDLSVLLDQLGLEDVRALGASAGGLTLLHMAIQDPGALSRMILVGVGTHFPPPCRESMLATDAESYSPEWWAVMRSRHPRGDGQIREIARYLRGLASAEGDVDFSAEMLSSIRAKTFIVQGDSDWCFPPPLVAMMHQAIPEASLWVIPQGEHVPILGARAPLFLDMALAFFQGDRLE
ncbi:MAG: alpha/beta fold hydrolase [Longimicrobiales bacterium]